MDKKLLSILFLAFLFLMNPVDGFGQCPTSVGLSLSTDNTICAGEEITFTAEPNGGTNLAYQWQIGQVNVGGQTSSTFTTASLTNGQKVRVVITSTTAGFETCSKASSEVTITVVAVRTPTVTISASKSSICPGESVTFTANNTNGGTNPQYSFFLNSGTSVLQSGSSNTFTTTTLNDGDKIRVELTSSLDCTTSDTAEADSNSIEVRPGTPVKPGIISAAETAICPGVSQIYSISPISGASSYQWSLPSGWSGTSTSTSITATAGTAGGTISVKAINNCGTGDPETIDITVKAGTPAVPANISGETAVCPGVSQTYSITDVANASEYIWTLPSGWSGSSTTNSITVNTGASGSGNISVQAKNECGTSTAKTLAVSVKPGTPATPVTISGPATVCPGTQQTYSITAVTGAASYIWTLPNGWTGTSTTNSITTTSGTVGGNITVKATNDCGTGPEQILDVTVKPGTPAAPGLVSGSNLVCPGSPETYSISPVSGATEYIWTLPSGWTGSSTSESITVTPAQSGNGNITVQAKNDCGTSTAATIAVSVEKPAPVMSGIITGPVEVCSSATGLVYSIPAITNATEYLWTLPSGWNITAGTGTRSITVSATSSSGDVSVIAKNTCGESSPSQILAVNSTTGVPATPGTITAPNLPTNAICPPATGIQFNVPEVTGAQSYLWTLPSGWEITSGSGTNSIIVRVNATAATTANASISVEAVNICGNSAKSTLTGIAIDNHVVTNAGADKTTCKVIAPIDIEGIYSFSGTNANLKPIWSVSAGMGSFGNTSKLVTTFTPSQAALDAGSVILTLTTDAPSGACGPGKDEMKITFKPLPIVTITATSPVCNGNTATLTFDGTPNSRVTYKLSTGTNQTIDIGSSGTATVITPVLTANSTFSLVSSVNLDTPACSNTLTGSATITVTPKPTATITYTGSPFCTSQTTGQNPSLNGTGAFTGGSYSSTAGLIIDNSTGAVNPSTSTPGTYTITYSTPEGGGCEPVTATTEVTITKAPTASISYAGTPFCTSDSTVKSVTLTGTDGFSGGTFSAPSGLTIDSGTGAITASNSTAGTYLVTYQTPVAGGCSSVSATTEVTITKAPTVTISYSDAPFCLSDPSLKAVTLTGTDAYTGGTYSAPAGLSVNPSTGEIKPSESNVGTHTVTYTSPATSGCGEVTATTDVTITQTPSSEISYSGPFCNSDENPKTVIFTNTSGAYEGGTFSSSTGLSIDTATGTINAKTSSPGEYTVAYNFPSGGGCATSSIITTVIITQVPTVDISYNSPFCNSESDPVMVTFLNGFGEYEGGTFSGSNGLTIDSEGNIDPSNSSPGTHTITYSTPEANGCGPVQVTTQVEIFEKVQITTQPVNIGVCSTQPASFEVVATGENLTYLWKRTDGVAISNATGITSAKLNFNNATSLNAGEYFVEVSGTSPCSMVPSEPVTLNVDENIIIEEPLTEVPICGDGFSEVIMKFIAHANGAPLTFKWYKGNAVVDESDPNISIVTDPADSEGRYTGTLTIINVTTAYNGDYHVEVSGPEEFTCSTAVTNPFQLRLNEIPALPEVDNMVVCQNETPPAFTVTSGTNLKWYVNENDENFIVGESGQPVAPVPPTDVAGDFYYWVTQQPESCESEKVQVKVTVNEKPSIPVLTTEEASIEYCLGVTAAPLTATGLSNTSLNWYDSETGEALTSAPTPNTENSGETKYWVSQTPNDGLGCESDRAEITVTVFALPEVTASVEDAIICLGSPAELSASDGVTFIWYDGEDVIGNEAIISHIPTEAGEYTFTVVVTDVNGCENTANVNVQVDENTVAGTLTGPASVCISSPSGTLNLADYTGAIVRWETSTDGGTNWTPVANNSATLDFADLTATTSFRAIVKSGVCDEMASNEIEVTIDPLPVGGDLAFAGNGRVFTICENPVGNYAVDLNLTGVVGDVIRWGYRSWDATGYTTLIIGGEEFTGNTLPAAQIQALNFNETTVFQVEVSNGACTGPAFSKTAILSVIPSDITPTPVTVDPGVVCIGEEVTLSSETGYQIGGTILDQGAFDNASITNHGWRIRREGISGDLGFDTDANNTEFDRWKRATPRAFTTASVNSPFNTSGVVFDTGIEDGNKGFGLISGNYRSTMETPVFTIGAMDQAILTFDQAYVLTPGSSLKVEISTDGGNTYTTLYIREVPAGATQGIASGNTTSFGTGTIDSHPENKILIDLGDYIGRPNLRIRFNYSGSRPGDIWAVDNIDIPEGPNGITMEWRDYTDPAFPEGILIGTNNSENYTPTEIGLNTFEVKTKLVYNSSGDACEVAENAQRIEVFVFDKYTTSVTASYGTCGNFNVQLTANVLDGKGEPVTSFPTPDGYIGKWEIVGEATLVDSNTTDEIAAINDPNAILSAAGTGSYTVSWILEPTELDENGDVYINPEACPPIVTPLDVVIEGCIALDFDGFNDYVDLGTNYTGSNYSIEAWIRPLDRELETGGETDASNGTIISGAGFEIKMQDLPGSISPNGRWYHIAYTSDKKLFIDGVLQASNSINGVGGSKTLIGARWDNTSKTSENHFSGWIEEVRIWNGPITEKNIQFTMNQRLKNAANIGEVVDMDHPDAPDYGNLAGYYRLISAEPDPANLVEFAAGLMPTNGITPNLANAAIPGRLINMETNQQNTAPLPYFSGSNNSWDIATTWARPDVWDIPNKNGINWNIVKTSHNITAARDITVLGLISEANTLDMVGAIPGNESHMGTGTGNALTISHYLKLDGIIDLNGESQLLQPPLSIVDEASSGHLDRDQQGKRNSFIYNYWASPVSTTGSANNGGYTVGGILLDGTNPAAPVGINFQDHHGAADATRQTPIIISTYWLWAYTPAAANVYAEWDHIRATGSVRTGEGFTMKGTAGDAVLSDGQNYTFRGKPHNGDISLSLGPNQNYLIGNPYPSSFDAFAFINDNLGGSPVFDGSLYFWDHFVVVDHILKEYIGGYAVLNLSGGVPAASIDERINDNDAESGKIPQQYIPVGQGFLINSTGASGGSLSFKNSQRVYEKEGAESIFLKPEIVEKTEKAKSSGFKKIRLSFKSPVGYNRQILVGAVPTATDGFDLGYDAHLFDNNVEDMYWVQDKNNLVIQAVADFDKERVIPLGVKIKENKEFRIRIDTVENAPASLKIYLNDKLNDSIHDLRKSAYLSTSEPGTVNDRFEIIFQKDEEVLPPAEPGPGEIDYGIVLRVRHSYSSREIQILNPDEIEISNLYLFDLNGNLLEDYDQISNEKEIRLPVRGYSSGVYILKLYAKDKMITKKIIISN